MQQRRRRRVVLEELEQQGEEPPVIRPVLALARRDPELPVQAPVPRRQDHGPRVQVRALAPEVELAPIPIIGLAATALHYKQVARPLDGPERAERVRQAQRLAD